VAGITLDESQWPMVFTRFDAENTPDELERYIHAFDRIHRLKVPYATISFMKEYSRDPKQVDRVRRWMKESEADTRTYCVGTGIITQSLGFRFLLSAIFVVKPLACPYDVCGSWEDAEQFIRKMSDKRGLKLPDRIRCPWPELTR
jgi:hypothetical protein